VEVADVVTVVVVEAPSGFAVCGDGPDALEALIGLAL
jgi:hypothetical protein